MTEHEWLTTSDPRAMLGWLLDPSKGWMPSDRKLCLILGKEGKWTGRNSPSQFLQIMIPMLRGISLGLVQVREAFTWQRGGQDQTGKLALPDGWRKTDMSWRASLRDLM
ncbi:MAG: hypothetical protein L0Z62_43060, partial [Gemmataceae bacterium]|nr:hypothetical protein [Gemmataceae bacterium]